MIRATEASHAVPRTQTVATIPPKQPTARRLRDWYPYYAGFTERFVNAVIDDYLQGSESVVDPWSGAGTTTVACLRCGIESWGVDINPVATVIARARLNPRSARGLDPSPPAEIGTRPTAPILTLSTSTATRPASQSTLFSHRSTLSRACHRSPNNPPLWSLKLGFPICPPRMAPLYT